MNAQRLQLPTSMLDLALSYSVVLCVVLLVYPLLNKWLLEV
jgi:hypothetical protein